MKNELQSAKIVFLGSGFMAGALIRGITERRLTPAAQITVRGAAHPEKVAALRSAYGVREATDTDIAAADLAVLAFKPQNFEQAMAQYAHLVAPDATVLSILAGTTCAAIERALPGRHVVRAMPNLALSVGLAATGYCLGSSADGTDADAAQTIFGALGAAIRVKEEQMSDVTALSGSGPAYFYLLAEAMTDAASARGMNQADARMLAVQTLVGAARLIADSGDEPAAARAKITSKGGTTDAAVRAMTEAGFCEAVAAGMAACARRSDELGK